MTALVTLFPLGMPSVCATGFLKPADENDYIVGRGARALPPPVS